MKTKILSTLLVLSLFLIAGCGGGGGGSSSNSKNPVTISGFVQKGPFINGTSITIYELQENLLPSGKSFDAQIKDNSGKFSLDNVSFSSKYVKLKADGFYYNEILGDPSSSQLTLYALSDITDKGAVNINLLSHLEKDRLEYLVEQGKTFSEAKKQAQKEILNIFSLSKDDIKDSETLDIATGGDDNAILLAISIILQGYRTTSELSELLANIATDIRTDGVLDSSLLGSQLIDDAKLINLSDIRTNLVNRYNALGLAATIPAFEQHVNAFLNNTNYVFTKYPQYPQDGIYGKNILYGTEDLAVTATVPATDSDAGMYYDLAAALPVGASLKVIMKLEAGVVGGIGDHSNWHISPWNGVWNGVEQTFTVIESGKPCNAQFYLIQDSSFTVEYYENNSATPTRTKRITVLPAPPKPTYTISGTVTWGGSALSGVTVALTVFQTFFITATTDSNGYYSFPGFQNGTYIVTPEKTNYTFTPPSLTVEISGSDKIDQHFTAASSLP